MKLTKLIAKELIKGDYIPGGDTVKDIKSVTGWRKTREYEVYRCGRKVCEDIQSGPIYCGDVAEFIASLPEGLLCLCEAHTPKFVKDSSSD